jgi:GDP-L-fucose synthase
MNSDRLFIAGHRGMVGRALVRRAEALGCSEILTAGRREVDLTDQRAVREWIREQRPEIIIVAAAKVGGIVANSTQMADFFFENAAIAINVIRAAWECRVPRLLSLGSSCIYPREAPQPMPESCLLSGPLEGTNEGYALAKIAGLKFCQYLRRQHGCLYHSVMPTNLYGPGDNYHPEHSHVIPGLIRRFHEARERRLSSVTIWGTGSPRREFLHVDDLAEACFHMLGIENPPDWVNVGFGTDISILELAHLVKEVVGYEDAIVTDPSKPDGTPRKLLDVGLMRSLGWEARIELRDGLAATYQSFLNEIGSGTLRS